MSAKLGAGMSRQEELAILKRDHLIYHKILDTSADGFVIVDKDGFIIDVNNAYSQFLGFESNQDIVGKYILEVIRNSVLPEVLLTGRTDVDVVHRFLEGQGGKEHLVAVMRTAVTDGDKVVAALGQVKFSRETRLLAEKLQDKEDELNYYKNELKRMIGTKYTFDSMIGTSCKFREVKTAAEKSAGNDFSILITGETGTGKEIFAAAIHNASKRRLKPFIRINCAAIPNELLESELFGYEDGAFTGARRGGKAGKFEIANGGTLFLDEIGEMPLNMQAKLLRVLQEKEVERIGGVQPLPINVRILAATNQDLEERIRNQTFRSDLFYRLNVIPIKIPPLRERPEDVKLFVDAFLEELFDHYGIKKVMDPSTLNLLKQYDWPGNVRELKNVVQRAYALSDHESIQDMHLPVQVVGKIHLNEHFAKDKSLEDILGEVEKELLLNCLRKNSYNCRTTAKELGIHRSTLYKKFEKFQIVIPRIN